MFRTPSPERPPAVKLRRAAVWALPELQSVAREGWGWCTEGERVTLAHDQPVCAFLTSVRPTGLGGDRRAQHESAGALGEAEAFEAEF